MSVPSCGRCALVHWKRSPNSQPMRLQPMLKLSCVSSSTRRPMCLSPRPVLHHLVLSHPSPSRVVPSHLSCPVSSLPILTCPVPSHLALSRLFPSCPCFTKFLSVTSSANAVPSNLSNSPSHPIPFYSVPSHPTHTPHPVPPHPLLPDLIHPLPLRTVPWFHPSLMAIHPYCALPNTTGAASCA